jgi:pimeloyl-ACP methyl ester carboxylesterase
MGPGLLKRVLLVLLGVIVAAVSLIALFPEKTTAIAFDLERYASGLERKTIVVGDETWHYLDGGPRDADVLLMIHGFGADKDNWTRFAGSLTNEYRVIAPDLAGFGESRWHPDWDYSLIPQRDRLASLVKALGLEHIHLIGNSMGGQLAALYTYAHPEDVISLSLVNNAGVTSPDESDFQQALAQGENPLVVRAPEDFDRLLEYAAYKEPFVPWPIKSVLAQQAVDRADKNQRIFIALRDDQTSELEPLLGQIEIPVQIIWGEYDRILDVSSIEIMLPLLPQAKVVIMEDTGHLPMLERPSETAAHYLEFLRQVNSRK